MILPHHHHEGVFCVIMEHCEHTADEHTDHNDEPKDTAHEKSCIAESDYIASEILKETIYSVLFFPGADLLHYSIDDFGTQPEYGEYISFYQSATTSRIHGLRAPPAFLF
jgi:hypothetical protein